MVGKSRRVPFTEALMANEIFELSAPRFERHLRILGKLLERAEMYAKDRGIESVALISARLFPDMFPSFTAGAGRLRYSEAFDSARDRTGSASV